MGTDHRHPLIAGALSGAGEIICTYPLEYVKTQLQLASLATLRGVAQREC
jgi:hypothetical protein